MEAYQTWYGCKDLKYSSKIARAGKKDDRSRLGWGYSVWDNERRDECVKKIKLFIGRIAEIKTVERETLGWTEESQGKV